ncbi:hypothetical protein [uncultured Ruegeria sp.]|uniref:hypothetical protein n=1 Tax=uncultured Ruegeria sp. TaxID=259304 RepID=UPI00262365FF|nr:hypothetical protein [uncultured Ruegeria sp.]
MGTGVSGQIAISWTQTEVDGLEAAPLAHLVVGAAWSWRGRGIDLSTEAGAFVQRDGYARVVSASAARPDVSVEGQVSTQGSKIELTNGAQKFTAELVRIVGESSLMLIFENGCPQADQEFWISAAAQQVEPAELGYVDDSNVVAFPGLIGGAIADPVDLPRIAGFAAE